MKRLIERALITLLAVLVQLVVWVPLCAAAEDADDLLGSDVVDDGSSAFQDHLTAASAHNEDGGLLWHDLTVSSGSITLLNQFSFHIGKGQLTGLLGPSGSGKSTLLQSLAGLSPLSVRGLVGNFATSENNASTVIMRPGVSPTQTAWLQQHDNFFSQLTVQETLQLASFLELPEASPIDRHVLVERTVTNLGLKHVRHRQIGEIALEGGADGGGKSFSFASSIESEVKRENRRQPLGNQGHLSGGERRRLSVALELLTQKQLLIADEPTSGLDSAYSATVMNLLKKLAVQRQIPAVCSLHQPRSSIWRRLDAVILLAPGGRVCYAGDRAKAIDYFANHGYELPANTNPAEFLIDLISVDSENAEQAIEDDARIDILAEAFAEYQRNQWAKASRHTDSKKHVVMEFKSSKNNSPLKRGCKPLFRWIPRLGALWLRSWRQNIRNTQMNTLRFLISIGNGLLLSGIFPTVAKGVPLVSSIADRCALISFAAVNMMMISYMKTVTLFTQERPVLQREQTRKQYSALEYLLAKVLGEIPLDVGFTSVFVVVLKGYSGLLISWKECMAIFSLLTVAGASLGFLLGSFAPTDEYATTSGLPVLILLMVVGIINPSGVDPEHPPPQLVRWMKSLSPFAYAIEALCVGEFKGVQFKHSKGVFSRAKGATRMGGLALISSGDRVLEALGLKTQTFAGAMGHLGLLTAGNLLLSWFGLMFQQRKHQRKRTRKRNLSDGKQFTPSVSHAELSGPKASSLESNSPLRVPTKVRL